MFFALIEHRVSWDGNFVFLDLVVCGSGAYFLVGSDSFLGD